ncbi:hypothetical protein PF010_g12631 [Phytophthora fragariae]|uniref:Uncharacterized protein n=1 Tax=Phytophthora fragariae TaxID=53985 RepID=A0A6G0L328_9STRA|nr:hypothetical protein PF010_g12631 [Phytophthora fragariae]
MDMSTNFVDLLEQNSKLYHRFRLVLESPTKLHSRSIDHKLFPSPSPTVPNQVGFGWKADPLVSSCRGPIKEVAEEVAAVEPSEPVVEAAVVESEEATEQQEQATAETDVEAAEPVVELNALV